MGEQVRRLPLHPRLARMLVEAGGARQIAQACALLSERHLLPPRTASTSSDLLSALDDWSAVPAHVQRAAGVIADFGLRIADSIADSRSRSIADSQSDEAFRRAILAGYPDRVAQRREPGSPNVLLASGTGATIAPESGVRDGEFLVALDVSRNPQSNPQSASRSPQLARVRIASRVEREWLTPTVSELVHRFDEASGKVRAALVDRYDALVLAERPAAGRSRNRGAACSPTPGSRAVPRDEDIAAAAAAAVRRSGRRPRRHWSAPRPTARARSTTCASNARCRRHVARVSIATRPSRSPCRADATRRSSTTRTAASPRR